MAKIQKKASGISGSSEELRQDIYVYNEATAFLLTSKTMAGKELDPDKSQWQKSVTKGEFIPIELYQDDPFVVRLVVNGSLTDQEESEWLGKFSHKLKVSDGKFAVCGGIEFIMEPCEKDDNWLSDYVRIVDIPQGDYQADIYTYITAVNGTPLLAATGASAEPIGAFFRRTRKNTAFPNWLKHWLKAYSSEDPGHESEWQAEPRPENEYFVDFLVHLTPLSDNLPAPPALSSGFYDWTHGQSRKPVICPLGIPAANLAGLPEVKESLPLPVQGVDILSWINHLELHQLKDNVPVSLSDIHQAFDLSWYASGSAHPEICLYGENLDELYSRIKVPNKTEVKRLNEKIISIRLAEGGGARWAVFSEMRALAKLLPIWNIPDGISVELCIRCPHTLTEIGTFRLKGPVIDSVWQINEVYPAVDATTLATALKLAREAEGGKGLANLDQEKSRTALELFLAEWQSLYKTNLPELKNAQLVISKNDAELLHLFMVFYFRLKYGDIWTCEPIGEELFKKVEINRKRNELAAQVILEGENQRRFVGASVETLSDYEVADANSVQKEAEELWAEFIGELACSQFPKMVFRYFTMPDKHSRLCWYNAPFLAFVEIIADFGDGCSLSTARQPGPGDDLPRKIYRLRCPKEKIATMYRKHLARVGELQSKHGGLRSFDGTLLECAQRFEESIKRQS